MSELDLILFAAAVAAIMALMVWGGTSASLRAAIRTSIVVLLGWTLAYQGNRPVSWALLPWRIRLMLLLSVLAVAASWGLHAFEPKQIWPAPAARADKVNVFIAAAFALLLILGSSPQRLAFALMLVSGSLILAVRRGVI